MINLLPSYRAKAILVELVRYLSYRPPLGGVELESLADVGGNLWINLEKLRFGVNGISQDMIAWIFSASHFSSEASLYIVTQVSYVLISNTKLNARYHYIIFWIVVSIKRLDAFDGVVLKKPLDSSLVYWVTSEAVNLPAEYSFCFALFDIFHHLGKDRAAWGFGRFGLLKNFHHVELLSLGYFFHLYNL
ncbi:MAG: hypothetical protein KIH67_001775 [Candidatus Moranbacteria bacterium]|nr:hypothetical protein [Candidatus Moranbacteria bacterium]